MSEPRRLIASLMKGDAPPADADAAQLLAAASSHGALPLIAHHLRGSGHALELAFSAAARMLTAYDAVRERELASVLQRFSSSGVPLLLFKGAALARTHYAHSALRPRCDTDVLIERDLIEDAASVLRECGYEEEINSGGELISRQRMWVHVDTLGLRHCIDLHWALSNRPRYARAFTAGELRARGVELQGGVFMPSASDALLLAALHLAGHHRGHERLIWLYDIHLLHATLSSAELHDAAMLARERKLSMALDIAIAMALRWFGEGREVHAAAQPKLAELADDLRHTPGLRRKLRLFREHLFPPGDYILQKYGKRRRLSLPALYVRRALAALLRR